MPGPFFKSPPPKDPLVTIELLNFAKLPTKKAYLVKYGYYALVCSHAQYDHRLADEYKEKFPEILFFAIKKEKKLSKLLLILNILTTRYTDYISEKFNSRSPLLSAIKRENSSALASLLQSRLFDEHFRRYLNRSLALANIKEACSFGKTANKEEWEIIQQALHRCGN